MLTSTGTISTSLRVSLVLSSVNFFISIDAGTCFGIVFVDVPERLYS